MWTKRFLIKKLYNIFVLGNFKMMQHDQEHDNREKAVRERERERRQRLRRVTEFAADSIIFFPPTI